MRPDIIAETVEREGDVERDGLRVLALVLAPADEDVATLDAEEEGDTDSETFGREGGAAEGLHVAVNEGGEGGEVAGGQRVGGVGEVGGHRGGAVPVGGALQGSATAGIDCAQRQRVVADQELDNGGIVVPPSSEMKGRALTVAG